LNGLTFMDFACIDSLAQTAIYPRRPDQFFDPTAKSVKSSRGLAGPNTARPGRSGSDTVSLPAGQDTVPAYPLPDGRHESRTRGSASQGVLRLRCWSPVGYLQGDPPSFFTQPHTSPHRPPKCSPHVLLQVATLCVAQARAEFIENVRIEAMTPTHWTARHRAQDIVGTLIGTRIGTLTSRRHKVLYDGALPVTAKLKERCFVAIAATCRSDASAPRNNRRLHAA
jgi:hypothetical protein